MKFEQCVCGGLGFCGYKAAPELKKKMAKELKELATPSSVFRQMPTSGIFMESPVSRHTALKATIHLHPQTAAGAFWLRRLLTSLARGRLVAKSAGSQPADRVHPLSLKYLAEAEISAEGLCSQSWDDYESWQPDVVYNCV